MKPWSPSPCTVGGSRTTDAVGGEGERDLRIAQPGHGTATRSGHSRVGTMPVPFGRHTPRCEPERPGRDEERPIGTSERLAERFDGTAIRIGSALEAPREREVVLEREVNHTI